MDTAMSPTSIKIKIGESGADFLKRNNLPAKEHVDKQPAGLNFYQQDWNTKALGTVIVENSEYSFKVPHAVNVTGTQDVDHMEAGLSRIHIGAGISASSPIMHDEARKAMIKFLQHLVSLGWKQNLLYQDPRLKGEEAYKYLVNEDDIYGAPVDYEPTFEQWMQLPNNVDWYLYAKDVFLTINLLRDRTSMDPNKPGAYFLSINLQSQEQEAKAQFEGNDREHWQELWVDKIKELKKERYAKEKKLIQRDFTIYTEYQEPKIHPLDPVEP